MMYDIKKGGIEVFMHDVRVQIVDVFRWICPRLAHFGLFLVTSPVLRCKTLISLEMTAGSFTD